MWTKSFSRYTHILLVSAAVIIGAQISISLFESDFRVSIGIFGIFMSLILFGKYPILQNVGRSLSKGEILENITVMKSLL